MLFLYLFLHFFLSWFRFLDLIIDLFNVLLFLKLFFDNLFIRITNRFIHNYPFAVSYPIFFAIFKSCSILETIRCLGLLMNERGRFFLFLKNRSLSVCISDFDKQNLLLVTIQDWSILLSGGEIIHDFFVLIIKFLFKMCDFVLKFDDLILKLLISQSYLLRRANELLKKLGHLKAHCCLKVFIDLIPHLAELLEDHFFAIFASVLKKLLVNNDKSTENSFLFLLSFPLFGEYHRHIELLQVVHFLFYKF
jgi:hypothetical protein